MVRGRAEEATKGDFIELTAVLRSLLGVTHEAIVTAAVARGLVVPPRVRCEYPALFLDIPDRFAKPDEWNAKTAAQRVKNTLHSDWGSKWPKKPVNAEAVDLWIETAHARLAHGRNESVRCIAMNRDTEDDYAKVWREFEDLIDFYRWLRPHVSPGGVFYVEP